jgi:hypothetical protein
MKKTTKIYAVLTRRLVQKLTWKKKANLYVLQQESQQIIKTSENFAALKNLGTTLINLNYNIFLMYLKHNTFTECIPSLTSVSIFTTAT